MDANTTEAHGGWLLHAVLAAGLALAAATPGFAHHSGAMFDSEKTVEIHGVVREFQWTNPHSWIQVVVQDAGGAETEWSIEWGGINSLARAGWRPSTFPPGAEVTMRVHPMRNGTPAGNFVGAKLADGAVVGRWEEQPAQAEN